MGLTKNGHERPLKDTHTLSAQFRREIKIHRDVPRIGTIPRSKYPWCRPVHIAAVFIHKLYSRERRIKCKRARSSPDVTTPFTDARVYATVGISIRARSRTNRIFQGVRETTVDARYIVVAGATNCACDRLSFRLRGRNKRSFNYAQPSFRNFDTEIGVVSIQRFCV